MRFARKLVVALWLGICAVYGLAGLERYRREAALFEADIQRDHHVMGRGIVGAVEELWQDEGQARALHIVERANERESQVFIRWVDPDAPLLDPHVAGAPPAALTPIRSGTSVSWTDRTPPGRLYSYTPVRVFGAWVGAVEISESLEPERAYLQSSLVRMVITFGSLALITGLLAMAAGARFVGRPIRLLVEQARRIGEGTFDQPLHLAQRDELGELAEEMNVMSARLAEARAKLEAESRARLLVMEQLRHAERLTTVGKLASGVAHELGTPLNVIAVRSGMIADEEVTGVQARDGARVIREQAERITRIVRQLLDFARQRTPERSMQDLVVIVERTVGMLHPIARKACVEMTVTAAERPIRASVDPVQLQQVILNLVMNGIQAMPDGGRLALTLRRVVGAAPPAGGQRGDGVEICVEDSGAGILPEHIERIFDPFFTTKRIGEGTGLGLSVAYGILREHGGWIDVASTPQAGTRFTLFVPELAG